MKEMGLQGAMLKLIKDLKESSALGVIGAASLLLGFQGDLHEPSTQLDPLLLYRQNQRATPHAAHLFWRTS